MPRKISSGQAGGARLAGIQAIGTTISANENLNIIIDPTGSGQVQVDGDMQLQSQSLLKLADSDSSNYVAFRAPTTVSSNVTWTLPNTDGSSNQALTTNGSGTLQWTTTAVAITDETSDSNINYLTFTTATSGGITTARVASANLTFQPSTSTLLVNGTVNSLRTDNTTTVSKTLQLADRDKVVLCNNTSNIAITIPNDSTVNFPVGSIVHITRINTGEVTLAAQSPATLTRVGDMFSGEELYCRKRAANSWVTVDSRPPPVSGSGGTQTTSGSFSISTYTTVGASTFTVA